MNNRHLPRGKIVKVSFDGIDFYFSLFKILIIKPVLFIPTNLNYNVFQPGQCIVSYQAYGGDQDEPAGGVPQLASPHLRRQTCFNDQQGGGSVQRFHNQIETRGLCLITLQLLYWI